MLHRVASRHVSGGKPKQRPRAAGALRWAWRPKPPTGQTHRLTTGEPCVIAGGLKHQARLRAERVGLQSAGGLRRWKSTRPYDRRTTDAAHTLRRHCRRIPCPQARPSVPFRESLSVSTAFSCGGSTGSIFDLGPYCTVVLFDDLPAVLNRAERFCFAASSVPDPSAEPTVP